MPNAKIKLYKKCRLGRIQYSVRPECLDGEENLSEAFYELPVGYKVTENDLGCKASAITKDGKMKMLHTDLVKGLPYVIESNYDTLKAQRVETRLYLTEV